MSRFARHTIVFSGLTLLSRITGLLRVMGLAAVLGSGRHDALRLNDAYQLANNIPNIIYEFIMGGLLSAIFMPVLVRQQERSGKSSSEAWRVANLLLGYVGVILASVAAIGVVLSPQLIHVMTYLEKSPSAFQSKELATYFFRFFAPQMFFYGLNAVFMAILNSHHIFAITAAAPVFNNIVVLTTLVLYKFGYVGVTGLAAGTTAGIMVMALVQVPFLFKIGMPIRPRVNFRDPVFENIKSLGLPVLALAIANLIGTAVRANLLYTVPGGYVAYTYSYMLIMMPHGIFAVAIATVLYPTMSRAAADGSIGDLKATLSKGLHWTTLAMLPIAVGMCLLAQPLARALFERENFTYSDSLFFSRFLAVYALSILPYSLLLFTTRAFYSLNDTLTPAWIGTGGVILNIVMNFLFMHWLSAPGIALSSTLTYASTVTITLFYLHRRIGNLSMKTYGRSAFRFLLAAAAMSGVIYTGLYLTKPEVVVLEKGTRLPLRVPAQRPTGSSFMISSPAQWDTLWKQIHKPQDTAPDVNFSRNAVLALIGPASPTTNSLTLRKVASSNNVLKISINVYAGRMQSRGAISTGSRGNPAYLFLQVPRNVQKVEPQFVRVESSPPGFAQRLLHAPDLSRLIILSLLGAVTYLAIAFLLGASELQVLLAHMKKRLGR
jgi:putative peptidoglycan lipid II flippase